MAKAITEQDYLNEDLCKIEFHPDKKIDWAEHLKSSTKTTHWATSCDFPCYAIHASSLRVTEYHIPKCIDS